MNETQGRLFLSALGVKVEYKGGWLRGRCPLARWNHQNGKDSSPSFGLKVEPHGASHYHCFACSSGALSTLVQELEMKSDYGKSSDVSYDFKRAWEMLEEDASTVYPLPEYHEFAQSEHRPFHPWPQAALDAFPPAYTSAVARRYLAWRGFTLAEAKAQDLRVDEYRNMLVFPYRNVSGVLAGLRGRLMDFGQPHDQLKHYDYKFGDSNNAYTCWLGEEILETATGPVVVVEGQFDRMRVLRHYPFVVANMTAKPSDQKLEKLLWAPGVVIMLDEDKTGLSAGVKWANRLIAKGQSRVGFLELADAPKSAYHVERDGPGAPKDPDEVDEGWLKEAMTSLTNT